MSQVETIIVAQEDSDIRLDRWFKRHRPGVSHGAIEKALRKGQIRLDGAKAKASDRVTTGQEIRIPPLPERAAAASVKTVLTKEDRQYMRDAVLYQDQDIIVLNKEAGMPVQGGTKVKRSIDSMLDALKLDRTERPKLVHRLDKDTSGILVLARHSAAAHTLTTAFKNKQVQKRYLAIVQGVPQAKQGIVKAPLLKKAAGTGKEKVDIDHEHGKPAETHYQLLGHAGRQASLVELQPITGRTHQLRVHMASIGHPIIGDWKYGGPQAALADYDQQLHLHACELQIPNGNKPPLMFRAPLPAHFEDACAFLGLVVKE